MQDLIIIAAVLVGWLILNVWVLRKERSAFSGQQSASGSKNVAS